MFSPYINLFTSSAGDHKLQLFFRTLRIVVLHLRSVPFDLMGVLFHHITCLYSLTFCSSSILIGSSDASGNCKRIPNSNFCGAQSELTGELLALLQSFWHLLIAVPVPAVRSLMVTEHARRDCHYCIHTATFLF